MPFELLTHLCYVGKSTGSWDVDVAPGKEHLAMHCFHSLAFGIDATTAVDYDKRYGKKNKMGRTERRLWCPRRAVEQRAHCRVSRRAVEQRAHCRVSFR